MLDGIKRIGFKYSTKAGITIGITDIQIPAAKKEILGSTEEQVDKIEQQYRRV